MITRYSFYILYDFICRYTFTVISNIIVHLATWYMFFTSGKSGVIGQGDKHKFEVKITNLQFTHISHKRSNPLGSSANTSNLASQSSYHVFLELCHYQYQTTDKKILQQYETFSFPVIALPISGKGLVWFLNVQGKDTRTVPSFPMIISKSVSYYSFSWRYIFLHLVICFQVVALFSVTVGCIVSLVFHIGVNEKTQINDEDMKETTVKIKKTTLLKNLRLYHIMGVYMMSQLYVNQSQVFIPLYLEEYLHIEAQQLPVLPLVMYISSSLTSFITKALNTHYGRKVSWTYLEIIITCPIRSWIGIQG